VDIAIIGAGNVGRSLAEALVGAGHSVSIASRDTEDAIRVAEGTGARAAASSVEAAAGAEVIVLAVYFDAVPAIAADIAAVVGDKVVVDVTNRMAVGPNGPEIDTTTSNAEEIARLFPTARVVKAFNTVFASHQADPIEDGIRLDGFVAGDDAAAKAAVLELVESIGLRPVDVGPLVRARQLEGLAFLNIALNIVNGGAWRSGWKLVSAPSSTTAAAA
jgi:NADPH-dependent F420 reductase